MHLAIVLALKQKPLLLSLYDDSGEYRNTAVADAVNAARLHGHCQVLVMNERWSGIDTTERLMADIEKFKRAVSIMEMAGERLTVGLYGLDSTTMRLDVALTVSVKQ